MSSLPKQQTIAKPKKTSVKYKGVKQKAPTYKAPANYKSQYAGQIDSLLNGIANREDFVYDPLQDASYQSLAKIYNKRGEQAARNTLGDAASLNGGLGSSYATTAAQQARNDYNQEFAALVPELEQNAYQRYKDSYDMDVSAFNALSQRDNDLYGRYRDKVSDAQWKYGMDYNAYRDKVSDAQWLANYKTNNLQFAWDLYKWGQDFNLDRYTAKKGSSSGGGRSSGGSSSYGSGSTDYDFIGNAYNDASSTNKNIAPYKNEAEWAASQKGLKKGTLAYDLFVDNYNKNKK